MKIELGSHEIALACREYIARHYGIAAERIPQTLQWQGASNDEKRPLRIIIEVSSDEDPYRTPANPSEPKT